MQVALHTGDFMVVCEGVVQVSTALPGRNKKTGDQKEGTSPHATLSAQIGSAYHRDQQEKGVPLTGSDASSTFPLCSGVPQEARGRDLDPVHPAPGRAEGCQGHQGHTPRRTRPAAQEGRSAHTHGTRCLQGSMLP